ncbi:MAG: TonB-dependent receptor [Bryobacterales bacterium]|nr:TonB-dependent receptor [Bryobacterales bacterium]
MLPRGTDIMVNVEPRGLKLTAVRVLCLIAAVSVASAEVRLTGKVAGETGKPIGGARITLRRDGVVVNAISDPTGDFRAAVAQAGRTEVEVDREGFFRLNTSLDLREGANEAQFVLSVLREVVESIDVSANPGVVDMDRTTPQVAVSGTTLLDVPYPATNTLRNALRIIPGMVQDGRGGVHLHGGAEEQTLYTLEGFQINDPLTGRFESRVSVESVQSIEATAGRPAAEFGKGSSGVLAIRSRTGDDKLRYSATNFVPGIEYQKGLIIGGWTPRANLSGPWKKGRAWFSDSFDIQFVNTVIRELPRGEDRTVAWRASNLLHNQINLTPSNILTVGSLFNLWFAPRSGLSVLDPRETTVDRRSRQWFTYIKDQIYFTRGALLEFGYSHNRTFAREIPQGDGIYIVSPFGKRGNYFIDSIRNGGRDQWLANLFAPSFTFLGGHQIKGGIDLARLFYAQSARRSGIEYTTIDFAPVRRTLFLGNGEFRRTNVEASAYVQDSWRVRPRLLLELGMRKDWDRLLRNWNFSPRLGFAWSPFGLESTKISGGFARIFDQTSLRVFTRPQDQYSVSTYFDPDGDVARGPALSIYRIDNPNLASPRYHNWNLGVEHQFPKLIQARVNLVRRRGTRGFTYLNQLLAGEAEAPPFFENIPQPVFDAIYGLSGQRADRYSAVEITLRQPIRQRYEWMFSYTRSRARSNAVIDQSVDEPLLIDDNAGALPWDTPNRWLSWAYLPTPWRKWAVAYLAEYRTGFPYSIQDANGQLVGKVNELRYPTFFELNLHIERTVAFRKQWWAVRAGFINITNHRNPNVVNNVVGSPNFLQVYGGQGRAFNVRIRWLGKQ